MDLALLQESVPASLDFSEGLINLWKMTKLRMEELHQKEKRVADRSRRESGISVGQLVMLSTRNLQLKGESGKLKPRFIGPFKVIELVGSNACRLDLPPTMRVHPVFNVQLLKIYSGSLQRPAPIEVEG